MSTKKTWCVYMHNNTKNQKKYIGITSRQCDIRWRLSGKGYAPAKDEVPTVFWNAIQKYGWESFEHIILEANIQTLEKAYEQEQYWINYYHTYIRDPECWGYNSTIGGKGSAGKVVSAETREKIGKTSKGRCGYWKGKKLPRAAVEKIAAKHRGAKASDETKAKMRASSKCSKAVICVETGVEYSSANYASLQLGLSRGCITQCLAGRAKTAGGYHWKYKED